ncbi:MAG: xanthine dehydrogenase small subunit [Granulosicoccaceae bacterium]
MIHFIYGEQTISLGHTAADTTVLEWLRLHANQTGTKEGCASGDCGACTVVVVELNVGHTALVYQPVNSCIAFVGSLHGKQLISVEQLADGTALHPVQQAMVDQHGSQCGFCTPGFIMSMFAHFHAEETTRSDPHQIEHALAGNLCRCTGYKPIKRAMSAALDSDTDQYKLVNDVTLAKLKALQTAGADDRCYLIPKSLSELFAMQQQHPEARVVAGATDLALEVTQQLKPIDKLIHLKSIPELAGIDQTDDSVTIGATVSVQDCLSLMAPLVPGAEQMLLRFGSSQVRGQATIGGNIGNASPIGDLPPLLLALDATLELQGPAGKRSLPINEFYLEYKQTALQANEIITAVSFTVPSADSRFAVYKISKRMDDDISAVCLAISMQISADKISSMRLALGGMAATPKRSSKAEQAAIGKPWNEQTVSEIQAALSEEFSPLSDARASAEYRTLVTNNLVMRFYIEGNMPKEQTQVALHVSG